MFGVQDFFVFLIAGITLNLMPGPDTMYILGRSLAQGRQAGVFSVLGISTGILGHTTAAAFGLSAVLVSSTFVFGLIKWAGAVYLVYLGVQMFRHTPGRIQEDRGEAARAGLWAIYRQGVLTNLLNPKVALFFMAFLPQFVSADRASSPVPFLFLGCVFVCTGTLWCLFLAAVAAKASQALRTTSRSLTIGRRITGGIFVGLGIRLAVQQAG
ncbi:MAG: LysE family translocator [Deltaproteobacteria bacterium]|nr:LysE family translocator [Deltaproteobacteria bacterium]